MDMMNSVASMASSMKQSQLMTNIGTAMTKKAMDTTQTQAQGIIDMAQNLPKVQGQIGSILDVRA